VAQFLDRRGTTHALIVHGHDGLDEISLSGPTDVWELENGDVTFYTIGPEEFGLESINNSLLKVDSIAASAAMLRDVLQGNHGPARDMVLANSAAALVAAGDASTLKEGVSIAAKSIDRGEAKNKLDALIELSNRVE
jgi:anthranilate phosphoribosyltransferase